MNTLNEEKTAGLTVDLKRDRIRIHKTTLTLMNNPKFFRMLVNPQTKCIIVENCDEMSDGAYRVGSMATNNGSFEVYSSHLVHEIADCAGFHDYTSVKLLGQQIHGQNAVFFRMESGHPNLPYRAKARQNRCYE
ncbi:MAG: hypothetical protein LUI10_07590 [Lachnospiraceae bacterium]|nr:hypothetical protein [Lachnospiraceae bacterium]